MNNGIITGPPPIFTKGAPFSSEVTAEKLNALGHGKIVEVVGNVRTEPVANGGIRLIVGRSVHPESRCYVITSETATPLPGVVVMDDITYDIDPDYTASLLGTLSAGVFTFTKPGLFLLSYTASVEMDLSGATTPTPGHVVCTGELRLGGVSLASTASATSAPLTPNFDGFIKWDGTEGQVKLSMADLVVESPVLTTQNFQECGGEGCSNAITDAELVDGRLESTPKSGTTDLNTNIVAITGSLPSGVAAGTVASQALIFVFYNADGNLKILDGTSERDPNISVYVNATGGNADCLRATLSILKL